MYAVGPSAGTDGSSLAETTEAFGVSPHSTPGTGATDTSASLVVEQEVLEFDARSSAGPG